MKYYRPGDTIRYEFTTSNPGTGAAADADSLPTAELAHNGDVDVAVTVTVTHVSTGRYLLSCVVPSEYATGDDVAVRLSATVSNVTGQDTPVQERLVAGDLSVTPLVSPIVATLVGNSIVSSGTTQAFRYCPLPSGPITVVDSALNPINLSGVDLKMECVRSDDPTDTFTLTNADGGGLTLGGTNSNQISVDYTPEFAGKYKRTTFAKLSGKWQTIEFGFWSIQDGPDPRGM